MPKKSSKKKQKMYNMRGCSKTRKNHLGGSGDVTLAYTGHKIPTIPNPHLISNHLLNMKGGSNCNLSNYSKLPINTNGVNPINPNTGPPFKGVGNIFNNASNQRGGCGCGVSIMNGGKKNKEINSGFMIGGVRHRLKCKCSKCKKKYMKGGNTGIPYANGLVGSPYNSGNPNDWPGVDGIPGNHNYIANNTYNNDISRQMTDLGANPPFLNGGKRKQKGGTISNFISQDLINLGRQFQYGIGSAYNALAGYSSPVNPLPWKDQMPTKSLNPSML